jgi:hypothetical protein
MRSLTVADIDEPRLCTSEGGGWASVQLSPGDCGPWVGTGPAGLARNEARCSMICKVWLASPCRSSTRRTARWTAGS